MPKLPLLGLGCVGLYFSFATGAALFAAFESPVLNAFDAKQVATGKSARLTLAVFGVATVAVNLCVADAAFFSIGEGGLLLLFLVRFLFFFMLFFFELLEWIIFLINFI